MIFAGPAGVGKCTLALLTAQALNCLAPQNGSACGQCAACRRIMAYIESRHKECVKGADAACGVCSVCQGRNRRHQDIHLIEPDKKTVISIDQIRDIIAETAFQPLEARYRVAIFDPADQMQDAAQNSLLKTLEEPPSRTALILIATNPYLLLETIRSRARILHFGEIPQEQIVRRLTQNEGKPEPDALLAAALSGGSLGAALEFNTAEYRDARESALEFVTLLLSGGSFARASSIVAGITKDKKDKDSFRTWMESASALLRDIYYSGAANERVGQRDIIEELQALRKQTRHSHLVRAIEAMSKLQNSLHHNVNRQIALEALFIENALCDT
jgi:DNA polymerase-3 subunit delta'